METNKKEKTKKSVNESGREKKGCLTHAHHLHLEWGKGLGSQTSLLVEKTRRGKINLLRLLMGGERKTEEKEKGGGGDGSQRVA